MNIQTAAEIITIITGVIGLYTYIKTKFNKSNLFDEMERNLKNNDFFYKIDYGENWYNKAFHNSEIEKSADQFFEEINRVCLALGSKKKFKKQLPYKITKALQDPNTQNYMYNYYHYTNQHKLNNQYKNLIAFAKVNEYFESNFDNPNAYENDASYNHFLNWR